MKKLQRLLVPALVLAAGVAVRLAPYGLVYGGEQPRLVGDSDPHYHVLRAEAWLRGLPGAPWRDPKLAWPDGADVPWPPLFDALVAGTARIVGGEAPSRNAIAAAAAPIPVVLSLLLILLVAAIGRRLTSGGWLAAFLVALLPAATEPSALGRVDQHVLEVVLFAALLVLFDAQSQRARGRWRIPAIAVVLTLAFWTWMGSALHLLPLLLTASVWHLQDDEAAGPGLTALATGGLLAATLLAFTVIWLGPPGALQSGATTGVGGLHVALLAATGAGASLLLALRRARRGAPTAPARRAAELALAAVIPGAGLLLVPTLRAGIEGGLVALFAANPWYDRINEFRPLLGSGKGLSQDVLSLLDGYGLVHAAAALGLFALASRRHERGPPRSRVALLLVTFGLLVPAALLRRRFGIYGLVPLALAAEAGIGWLASRLRGRLAVALPRLADSRAPVALLALVTVAPAIPNHLATAWTLPLLEEDCLRVAGMLPPVPGREGVLAPWSLGHLIRYFSDRPVIASPFGTEGGARVMEDTAGFWFATDQRAAEAVLERRHAGLVLLAQPVTEAIGLHPFAPPGTPAAVVRVNGGEHGGPVRDTESFWRIVPNRLFFGDGLPTPSSPALDAFRLLWETPTTSPENPALEERWMLYEHVAGARVRITGAGGPVRASIQLETSAGRRLVWRTGAGAAAPGVVTLRLPYASGDNAGTRASEWTLTDGVATASLVLHEADVREGNAVEVRLGPAAGVR